MKKFLCLALCMVMACLALVGCNDDIGSELYGSDGYYANGMQNDTKEPKADIDMYVVVSDSVDFSNPDVALQYNTVVTELNAHIGDKLNVQLYVHYIPESAYYDTIVEAVKPGYKVDTNNDGSFADERECTADLVFINSKQLFDTLLGTSTADNMLLSIDSQLAKTGDSGRLKAIIPDVLWDACEVETETVGADGTTTVTKVNYVVPNNRVVGEYEFLLLNRADVQAADIAEREITHGNYRCATCKKQVYEPGVKYENVAVEYTDESRAAEAVTIDVLAAIEADSALDAPVYKTISCKCGANLIGEGLEMIDFSSTESEYVIEIFKRMYGDADYATKLAECTKTGTFADKLYFSNGEHTPENDLYYCKVMSYPTISAEDAFTSAYAVVRDNANALRCMDIICALNNDKDFANLLQFGEERVNYVLDDNGFAVPKATNLYVMNPLCTANIMLMHWFDDTVATVDWGYSTIFDYGTEDEDMNWSKWTVALKESALAQNNEADDNLVK